MTRPIVWSRGMRWRSVKVVLGLVVSLIVGLAPVHAQIHPGDILVVID